VKRLLAGSSNFLTPFSRFRSQPSGNTGGQQDTLRLSCHDANWRERAETSKMDGLSTHFMIYQVLRYFFNLGPRILEMLRTRATLIRHCC